MEISDIKSALEEFLLSGLDRWWFIDPQVYLDGDMISFQKLFNECDADLLVTEVRTYEEDPEWVWWDTLKEKGRPAPQDKRIASLLPLMRVSRQAAEAILKGIELEWTGHPEALLPTLVNRARLKIEDFGGDGSFTPIDRRGLWYNRRTWHWCGPGEYMPRMLHFPIPKKTRELARTRIVDSDANEYARILYVSPVGDTSNALLPEILDVFHDNGADCLLLQYDAADLKVPPYVRLIRDPGHKWQLALWHLHPDMVTDYDYIFFWDDDIKATDFDPIKFTKIMKTNRLDMAQPAIISSHGLSHAITGYRLCPPPLRDPTSNNSRRVVGRLTNFVEIMVPVFTREAWSEFYGYLDITNKSGWGYDYIPLGRKGIIDALPVTHTRAVRSINSESQKDIGIFLDSQGLFCHAAVEHGWLLE